MLVHWGRDMRRQKKMEAMADEESGQGPEMRDLSLISGKL